MATALIWVEYNRFTIGGPDTLPGTTELPYANGLVAPTTDPVAGAVIVTGVQDDQVHVDARALPARPSINADVWQDVAEVGISWPGGPMRVIGADVIPPSALTFTPHQPPGPYRLLVCGRERDAGETRAPADPIEQYLVRVWPGRAPDRLIKTTSRTSTYWQLATPRQGETFTEAATGFRCR
ncbi:hypothetical protein E1293_24945 [Actinomadura darangshiensis]|uniref:Uncharacterized protein n=1 Tax=Actinomadura darangshiensis TaxID=705336 RepID=A0A4R5AX03_9ACTN|nr:hypothetical protein [Actinomadura darangshiensis]TDD78028.1 hypothetical protein E1293_24945 [Actinomadura darangshiensis]